VSGQLITVTQHGVCRYGSRLDCCYGWKRNYKGHCEATCELGCKYGECVGPNKCKCFPGFTGKTCNQDINECGLKPRPCKHRCMNTHGSYKCYCLNGYMLMPDGTCANSRTCTMVNCQYGCEEVKDEVHCLCPSSGLQLGPNGRTCIDIDECSTGKAICSYNRRCVNTFGSYYCKCQIGYELKYVNCRYDCVDVNECAANTHKCNLHAECLNTQGTFKCKCKQGYRGNGLECSGKQWLFPKGILHLLFRYNCMTIIRTSLSKIKNVIPEPAMTPAPKVHVQSFDHEDGIYDEEEKDTEDDGEGKEVEEEEEVVEEDEENQIDHEQRLRGDVFGKCDACVSFPLPQGNGYYMAVPAFMGHKKDVGHLKLLLAGLKPKSSYCLTFSYRLAGERVGKLRVFLDSNKSTPAWEQSKGTDESWYLFIINAFPFPWQIIFEAERGNGKTGEIGLDNVILLASGLCPEDKLSLDI
uniref:EGF like domain multiple 6 n=1 Tax=Sphenodon punctatus TaxID=8508 RepID=A0A8D0G8W2_SPHPU